MILWISINPYKMKTRYAVILIIVGIAIAILGALVKILHLTGADLIIAIGGFVETIGWLFLLIKILRNPKFKEMLDW